MSNHVSSPTTEISVEDTDSGVGIPCNGVSSPEDWTTSDRKYSHISDGEEQFECFGEGDNLDFEHRDNAKPSLSSDSFRSTGSVGSNGSSKGFPQRNTWLRTSLRRASGSSKRQSSNALASQLFRNGVSNGLNSSSRGSSVVDYDDMYSDQISLEDDVQDLNDKVHVLEQQVESLKEKQSDSDDRYSRVKQENVTLLTRIQSLEDQIRELEVRSEEQMKEGEKRLTEVMARHEKEKTYEIENYTLRLLSMQQEQLVIQEETLNYKLQIEKLKQENIHLQNQLGESISELANLQEKYQNLKDASRRERRESHAEIASSAKLLSQLKCEVEHLKDRQQEVENMDLDARPSHHYDELEKEIQKLKAENKSLRETNEDLQAQLLTSGFHEGRSLVSQGAIICDQELKTFSKEQMLDALKDQQEVNFKLRTYIDGILLKIMESYPQLLEVKSDLK